MRAVYASMLEKSHFKRCLNCYDSMKCEGTEPHRKTGKRPGRISFKQIERKHKEIREKDCAKVQIYHICGQVVDCGMDNPGWWLNQEAANCTKIGAIFLCITPYSPHVGAQQKTMSARDR